MPPENRAVLLVDWDNLAGAIQSRGKRVEARLVDDLYRFAQEHTGGAVGPAHMAATRFDANVLKAMQAHMIEDEEVRSIKQQADIELTVLAMDYLHKGFRKFVLVTGDQDFLPLVRWLRGAGCQITLVYGDESRLAPDFKEALLGPGLDSREITSISTLADPKLDDGVLQFVGLLELQRQGVVLGGKDRTERSSQLHEWGVLPDADDTLYWPLITKMCDTVTRHDTARLEKGTWLPHNAKRTILKVDRDAYRRLYAVDYLVRLLFSPTRVRGMALSELRRGPYSVGDGSELASAMDALVSLRLVRHGADGNYAATSQALVMGYLEPLWRVHAAIQAECYRKGRKSLPYNFLETTLTRGGVGAGRDQKASGRVREVIKFASVAGVTDSFAIDGRRELVATNSPLSLPAREINLAWLKTRRKRWYSLRSNPNWG